MSNFVLGRVLHGEENRIRASYAQWADQPVDQEMISQAPPALERFQTTIASSTSVAGPGTYRGSATRTLHLEPGDEEGWWLDRVDLPDSLPIRVAVSNIWTTHRNIVLCSGSPHNYMRMVEHIVALRLGMGLDNLLIRVDSGDPPLFDRGSLDLVEAVERAGIRTLKIPVKYVTVKEPISVGGPNGSFLTVLPCEKGAPAVLSIDCAVDFRSAIGKQRIKFDVTKEAFRHGAFARTNTNVGTVIYCLTIGKLFADTRNLGYTKRNILVAGRHKYMNEPRMLVNGKSLEAAWHRAAMDLLAAVSLIEQGRLVGKIVSFKAGHSLDVVMIKKLYRNKILVPFASQ